jgi:hypothetical protein
MNTIKYILAALLISVAVTNEAAAKQEKTDHMYIFGFSASFQDSTVYITDIQDVQGAWIDSKRGFLLGIENYSTQLQEHLANKLQRPNRVCITFYDKDRKKVEKKMAKLKKKYIEKGMGMYDVQYLTTADFHYEAVDMGDD